MLSAILVVSHSISVAETPGLVAGNCLITGKCSALPDLRYDTETFKGTN
jgi:hypothetical protein